MNNYDVKVARCLKAENLQFSFTRETEKKLTYCFDNQTDLS